jgi:DNA-binding MurR/RpiR family transcriptional regulator
MTTELRAQPTIEERVSAADDALSPGEREVARYILSHRDEIPFMSAAQIADALQTSNATVVRAAQRLGYTGLPELKQELAATMRDSRSPVARVGRSLDKLGRDTDAVLHHLLTYQIAVLDDARRSVAPADFRRAVELLVAADRVVVFGPGPNVGLVTLLVQGLRRFGLRALGVTERGQGLAELLLELHAGDVVVLMAYERTTREIDAILDGAETARLPLILITDSLALALRKRFAAALVAGRGSSTMFPTQVTTLAILEALLLAVAGQDRRRTFSAMQRLGEAREAIGPA